jgi:archaemetzincin
MRSRRALLQLATALPWLTHRAAEAAAAAARDTGPDEDAIALGIRTLARHHSLKSPPRPGDWLAEHREAGQTYAEYRAGGRQRVSDRFSTLRVVPIGPLTAGQSQVLAITNEFMKPFFGFALAVDAPVPLTEIAPEAQRELMPGWPQLLTTWLHQNVLMKRRQPKDAAVLGITAQDLWPGDGWNFVFGQATLRERVGVWSMARNGDADGRPEERRDCTLRTLGTAVHETAHMLGIRHCIKYECGMNGSNNADERDRQPFEFCPECQAKLWWTCRLDPAARSHGVAAVAARRGFASLAKLLVRDAKLLERLS